MKKWELAKKGISIQDSVVEAHPNDMQIRYLRSTSNFHLPFFFKRKKIVKNDLTLVTHHLSEKPLHKKEYWESEAIDFLLQEADLSEPQRHHLSQETKK